MLCLDEHDIGAHVWSCGRDGAVRAAGLHQNRIKGNTPACIGSGDKHVERVYGLAPSKIDLRGSAGAVGGTGQAVGQRDVGGRAARDSHPVEGPDKLREVVADQVAEPGVVVRRPQAPQREGPAGRQDPHGGGGGGDVRGADPQEGGQGDRQRVLGRVGRRRKGWVVGRVGVLEAQALDGHLAVRGAGVGDGVEVDADLRPRQRACTAQGGAGVLLGNVLPSTSCNLGTLQGADAVHSGPARSRTVGPHCTLTAAVAAGRGAAAAGVAVKTAAAAAGMVAAGAQAEQERQAGTQ